MIRVHWTLSGQCIWVLDPAPGRVGPYAWFRKRSMLVRARKIIKCGLIVSGRTYQIHWSREELEAAATYVSDRSADSCLDHDRSKSRQIWIIDLIFYVGPSSILPEDSDASDGTYATSIGIPWMKLIGHGDLISGCCGGCCASSRGAWAVYARESVRDCVCSQVH